MKFKLLLLILLSPFLALAQETEKDFQLGFTLSPTLSWLTNEKGLESSGAKAGFSYGVIADFGFAKNYYFATAFTLTTLNSEAHNVITKSDDIFRLQYIEVPLTLKLKSNESGSGRFYGQFGLGTAVKVSAKKDDSGVKSSVSSDVNPFRLGLIAGGGAEWNLGRNLSAVTGVTFNNGFTNTFKDFESKNPFVTIHLGVFF